MQLQLWAQVSTNNITLMPTEKGHWGFALQKLKPRDAWPQLHPQGEAKPRNMRVWWDVQEKHQDALDALEMDSEEETDAHHDLFSGHGVDGADMSTLAERIDAGDQAQHRTHSGAQRERRQGRTGARLPEPALCRRSLLERSQTPDLSPPRPAGCGAQEDTRSPAATQPASGECGE